MPLSPDQIRKITFDSYPSLIKYSKKKFFYIKNQGLSPEELVNESIINIFDCTKEFDDEWYLLKFLEKAIDTIGYNEKERLYDSNFLIKKSNNSGGEYSLLDYNLNEIEISEEMIKIYTLFEQCRFGTCDENKTCPRCSCKSFYTLNKVSRAGSPYLRCLMCRHTFSIQSSTYFHNQKLLYSQIYKIAKAINKDPLITSASLGKIASISHKTAWAKKRLFLSVSVTIKSNKVEDMLKKLLRVSLNDSGIAMIESKRKFSDDDIFMIRKMKNELGQSTKLIADCFLTDCSMINKIVKFKIYTTV